jgi:anti-sigma regulatory factor (Ser/Thr protein kinase)
MAGTDERHAQPDQAPGGPGGLPPPPERPKLDQLFDGESLYALRSAVAAHAADLDLAEQGVADLVLVAHELATNAVRHGGATPSRPARLRLWTSGGLIVCEVRDPGPGPADPATVGLSRVESAASNGRGLWIVRQLAQRLDITSDSDGTTVTAVVQPSQSTVD